MTHHAFYAEAGEISGRLIPEAPVFLTCNLCEDMPSDGVEIRIRAEYKKGRG